MPLPLPLNKKTNCCSNKLKEYDAWGYSLPLSLSLYPYPIHIVAREAKSNTVCEDRRQGMRRRMYADSFLELIFSTRLNGEMEWCYDINDIVYGTSYNDTSYDGTSNNDTSYNNEKDTRQ